MSIRFLYDICFVNISSKVPDTRYGALLNILQDLKSLIPANLEQWAYLELNDEVTNTIISIIY